MILIPISMGSFNVAQNRENVSPREIQTDYSVVINIERQANHYIL